MFMLASKQTINSRIFLESITCDIESVVKTVQAKIVSLFEL